MDIHPPHGPVNSVKEFGIHIAIVTIGILIALSLEGVIETVRNATLVRETRDNFRAELELDRKQAQQELARDREIHASLDQLVTDLPFLLKSDPAQIHVRLAHIRTSGYFLLTESWQTALSTGALAHMPTEEVQHYAAAYYLLRTYSDLERTGLAADTRAQTFFLSHAPLQPGDYSEGAERIATYDESAKELEQVCKQLQDTIDHVLPARALYK